MGERINMTKFYVTTISNADLKIVFKTVVVNATSPDRAAELAISEGYVTICVDSELSSSETLIKLLADGINDVLSNHKNR